MTSTARKAARFCLRPIWLRRSIKSGAGRRQVSPAQTAPWSYQTRSSVMALFPVRIFLAAGWLRAGAEKLIDGAWWRGEGLEKFLEQHRQAALPFFRPAMEHLIAPMSIAVAFVVMATEIAIGIAIGVGRPLRLALRWGVVLNVAFVLSGAVNPSAFYLVMQFLLLFAIADGTIGVKPSMPTRRSFVVGGVALGCAAALAPYIRTLEPAGVIADPAMMLVFLSVLLSCTVMLRWLAANTASLTSGLGASVAPVLFRWLQAKQGDDVWARAVASSAAAGSTELMTPPNFAPTTPSPEAPRSNGYEDTGETSRRAIA